VIFDLKDNKILAVSRLEESHSEPISDFVWLKVIWWEIKGYNVVPAVSITIEPEKPLILMDKDNEIEKEYGGTKIEYNPEAGATKFLIGTEQGTIFVANKKKNEADIQNKLGFKWGRHLGPIYGMQRCPVQTKFFLTVGDWTSRVFVYFILF
jgi:dynein intermediate chain 2